MEIQRPQLKNSQHLQTFCLQDVFMDTETNLVKGHG